MRGFLIGFENQLVVRILFEAGDQLVDRNQLVARIPFEAGKNAGNGTMIWLSRKRGVLRIMVRRLKRI